MISRAVENIRRNTSDSPELWKRSGGKAKNGTFYVPVEGGLPMQASDIPHHVLPYDRGSAWKTWPCIVFSWSKLYPIAKCAP